MEAIRKLYENPETGLLSKTKFINKAKKLFPNISISDINSFIEKQESYQITKKVVRRKKYLRIASEPYSYQIDIMYLNDLSRANSGYKYILCIVEINSRKAFCYPLKTRTMDDIIINYKKFLTDAGTVVRVDGDDEFNSQTFIKVNKDNNIILRTDVAKDNHIVKSNGDKLAIVDSFVRTFRLLLNRYLVAYNTAKWIDVLDKLVSNYNNTVHSSLNGLTPNGVYKQHVIMMKIYLTNLYYNNALKSKLNSFNVGDHVRIVNEKSTFDKGTSHRYSRGLYTVVKMIGNKYQVRNENDTVLKRLIKPYEMIKVDANVQTVQNVPKEDVVKEVRKANTIERRNKKEGVNDHAVVRGLRERRPKNQLEHSKYGTIKW